MDSLNWQLRSDGYITGTTQCMDTPIFRDSALAHNETIRQRTLTPTELKLPAQEPLRRPRRLQ